MTTASVERQVALSQPESQCRVGVLTVQRHEKKEVISSASQSGALDQ